jgi:hypothetical protein
MSKYESDKKCQNRMLSQINPPLGLELMNFTSINYAQYIFMMIIIIIKLE